MTPYAIPNNMYLAKDALKYTEGPPGLLWRPFFEPGAGCGGQKMTPYYIPNIMYLAKCALK